MAKPSSCFNTAGVWFRTTGQYVFVRNSVLKASRQWAVYVWCENTQVVRHFFAPTLGFSIQMSWTE